MRELFGLVIEISLLVALAWFAWLPSGVDAQARVERVAQPVAEKIEPITVSVIMMPGRIASHGTVSK